MADSELKVRTTVRFPVETRKGHGVLTHYTSITDVESAAKVAPDFDATPIEGDLDNRFAALTAFVDNVSGKNSRGAVRGTEVALLSLKYGSDAVQRMFSTGRFTGM